MRWFTIFALLALGCGSANQGSPPSPVPAEKRSIMRQPLAGSLTSQVFENERLSIAPAIVYDIEVPLEPFRYRGEETETEVSLERIRFNVAHWRDLSGREFRFPVNPAPGYIDGSVYLGGAHNPVDVTRIRFGPLEKDAITAEIDIAFDFEYEGNDALGRPSATWQVVLNFDPQELDEVAAKFKRQ